MLREEAIEMWVIPALKNTWNEKKCDEILKALDQDPVFSPPCQDCNTKMDEIRRTYDKLQKQEPCDAVSRKAAIDACLKGLNRKEIVANIKSLPSVQPECTEDYCPAAFKPVECEDCVSREEVIKAIYDYSINIEMSRGIEQYKTQITDMLQSVHEAQKKLIENLPSVTPAEKVGRWVFVKGYEGILYECTVCRNKNTHTTVRWNYCPHCGAKMQEVDE